MRILRLGWLSLGIVSVLLASGRLTAEGFSPAETFFEEQVRPLLVARCQECHGGELQESGLRLDSHAGLLSGGISGAAAVIRDVEQSLLLKAVRGDDGIEQMPPDEPLSKQEVAILERWVRIGLPWPGEDAPPGPGLGDQVAIREVAKNHWAFQPLSGIAPPVIDLEKQDLLPTASDASELTDWSTNPIDAFVLRRLLDQGLTPNGSASRPAILRRLSFDLIGLPPSPGETQQFANDPRPTNELVAEWAERLLDSPHHGERWARYWLDLARYADTRDWQAQAELRYPHAYTYRDYVIESLNEDKPYDQFIREQLAADLITDDPQGPELAALGFLTVGPLFRNNQHEQVSDRIDVVCRGLMGITVSCARCHDHKYDPVPIEDYYSLYGVFASSETPATLPVIAGDAAPVDQRENFDRQLASKQQDLTAYKHGLRDAAIEDLQHQLPKYLAGFYAMSIEESDSVRGVIGELLIKETAMTPLDKSLARRLQRQGDAKHPVLRPWHQGLSVSASEFAEQHSGWLEAWGQDETLNPFVRDRLSAEKPTSRRELLESYAGLLNEALTRWQALIQSDPGSVALADPAWEEIRLVMMGSGGWFDLDVEEVTLASRLLGQGRKALGDLEKAITEVEAEHPGAPPRAMVVKDRDPPVNPFVMLRGEPNRRGAQVPRRFLSILSSGAPEPFTAGSGRRELAESIVDPANPLTARVAVNRIWARYFGTGLAKSLDDFGLRSEPPSHPELLDWLAQAFIDHGWSQKWLHRLIVTSAVYQQSSASHDAGLTADPENRLLWRQNRRRLDFEAMRDAMLVVAGTLDPAIGGRSVRLSDLPHTTRRTVYAYVDRVELDPILRTFDFASPTASSAWRAETTIPQQALFGMNHPFVAEQARELARRARQAAQRQHAAGRNADEIRELHRFALGRVPTADERKLAVKFLEGARQLEVGQSSGPWRYGYGPFGPDLDGFASFQHWTGAAYQVGEVFPDPEFRFLRLTSTTGHPGHDAQQGVIRRWVAPASGVVRIRGELVHERDNSDGVIAAVRSVDRFETFSAVRSEAKTNVDAVPVSAGDVIDFIVSPGKNPSSDVHRWSVVLEGIDGDLKGQKWDSRVDFGAPPPPPLDPLSQLAQAMLLTNEFLYLD